jgi:hypothetical protein
VIRRQYLLVVLASLCAGPGLEVTAEGESGWKAGVAQAVITPTGTIWLAGYGARKKPSEGVRQDLYVKTLALQDETGNAAVLVTLDLVKIRRDEAEIIAERVRKKLGLSRDRLLINASHTHSGPVVGEPPGYADVSREQEEVIRRYTAGLLDKVVESVEASIRDLAPATLSFEQGLAAIAVNRRRARDRSLPGPVDHDVPVLAVRAPDGKLRAVAVGYACHATSLGDYQIGADWPGYAKEEIEKAHPGATALFVQGCGADSNPLPRYQGTDPTLLHYAVELAARNGRVLAAAVDLVLHGKMKPVSGPLKSALELVDIPIHGAPTRDELRAQLDDADPTTRRYARRLLDRLEHEGKLPDRYPYPVQVWRFGSGLKLIALGGEVVVDFSLRLKAQHGWDDTWVAGYSNDVSAYIPSLRVLKEGGYEGGDANTDLPGPFGAAVEEIIIEKVNDLVRRTGGSASREAKP